MNQDSNLIKQIEEEANNSLSETMWGGYANDIITGIANNGNVKPNRAIWELVQNARDVSLEGGKSRIVFQRKKECFVFQHNGQPFDRKSLQSLILQTSSKVRQDIIQVGQYGTGFLTTHKFGLKFRLSGSLQLLSGQDKYYNFDSSELLLDRSSSDKKVLSGWLNSQIVTTQQWGCSDFSRITDTPTPLTTFTYLHEHPIERSNVAEAFETSPALVPYVLVLNPYVESITFIDETDEENVRTESFCFSEIKPDCEFGDCDVKEVVVKHSKTGQSDESLSVFLLQSSTKKEEKTGESVVTVILPLKRVGDKKVVISLSAITPQLFLYLPLLGTTEWGWNFILHAPSFTCDQDSRDRLLLVGNGQNNDNQAEKNRELIDIAKGLIQEYLNQEYKNFVDVKHLCKVDFTLSQPSQELADHYKQLQNTWVEYFEGLELVDNKDKTATIAVRNIRVLDKELYEACEDDTELLDALYDLLSKQEHKLTLPCKEDLVYWSRVTDEWYKGRENLHVLSIDRIVDYIKDTVISQADLKWLHKLCLYFKDNNHADYFKKAIIPNEELKLHVLTALKKPAEINGTLRNALKTLLPETVESFVHADFVDIVNDGIDIYDDSKIKESLAGYLTGLPNKAKELKNAIIAGQTINPAQYENVLLPSANIHAILDLYKMCLSESATGFVPNTFNLLCEFYEHYPNATEKISKEVLDVRSCYRVLICDSLFRFTLDTNKASKRDWCFNMTKELKTFSDANDFLREYQIYPNQMSVFRYAEQLKKEEDGIPERLKEIYDIICRNVTETDSSKSIKHELVCKEFAPYFIGESTIKGKELSGKIEEPFEGDNGKRTIEGDSHQDLFLEIIERITDKEQNAVWYPLFTTINKIRASLMLSVVTSPSKKESIFKIVRVKDEGKLRAIAELSEQDNIEDVVELGKMALAQQQDAEYKNMLGNYVESHLLEFLREKLSPFGVVVENQQGGQDFILSKEGYEKYFVEVKSRWENDQSVLMSNMQFHRAVENADRYALVSVNMYHYDQEKAKKNEPLILKEIYDDIKILDNIGYLEKELQVKVDEAFKGTDADIRLEGTYGVRVPQSIFKDYPLDFDNFIIKLKKSFRENGAI